jgi:hypothetical protein
MCLTLRTKRGSLPSSVKKIAKKDIKCYKILESGKKWANQHGKGAKYRSLFIGFEYELGFTYYQTGKEKFKTRGPFNSWRSADCAEWEIHDGLHSFTSKSKALEKLKNRNYLSIIECTIPKGAEYYIGLNDDYVSDQLTLNKEI